MNTLSRVKDFPSCTLCIHNEMTVLLCQLTLRVKWCMPKPQCSSLVISIENFEVNWSLNALHCLNPSIVSIDVKLPDDLVIKRHTWMTRYTCKKKNFDLQCLWVTLGLALQWLMFFKLFALKLLVFRDSSVQIWTKLVQCNLHKIKSSWLPQSQKQFAQHDWRSWVKQKAWYIS